MKKNIPLIFLVFSQTVSIAQFKCTLVENPILPQELENLSVFGNKIESDGDDVAVFIQDNLELQGNEWGDIYVSSARNRIALYQYSNNPENTFTFLDIIDIEDYFPSHILEENFCLKNDILACTAKDPTQNSYYVIIFRKTNSGEWQLSSTINDFNGNEIGIHSIAINGNWLIIGNGGYSDPSIPSNYTPGCVYVYQLSATDNWEPYQQILPNLNLSIGFNPEQMDLFGTNIKSQGNNLLIGRYNMSYTGNFFLYKYSETSELWEPNFSFLVDENTINNLYSLNGDIELTTTHIFANFQRTMESSGVVAIPIQSLDYSNYTFEYSTILSNNIIELEDGEDWPESIGFNICPSLENSNILLLDGYNKLILFENIGDNNWIVNQEIIPDNQNNGNVLADFILTNNNILLGGYEALWKDYEINNTSQLINFSCNGLELSQREIANSIKNLTIYPNPSKGYLTIEFSNLSEHFEYYLTALSGNLIQKGTVRNTEKFDLDLSNSPTGVYVLTVISGSQTYKEKIVLIN